MDSSKITNTNAGGISPNELDSLHDASFAKISQLQTALTAGLDAEIQEVRDRLSKSFRHFLLVKEQERMPFLQRVMTAHMENMEDQRGFPPRHPIHWFKSKLEFSSTGILEFDLKKDAEAFMRSVLAEIESEIKDSLNQKQSQNLALVDTAIGELQQEIAAGIQPIAKAKKIVATDYVNSFIQPNRLDLKAVDRFYYVSLGKRFDPQQELIYSEVCVRPTGIFSNKDTQKPNQLKYAISCDRLLDVANESIERAIRQIDAQTQTYLTEDVKSQLAALFQGLSVG